MPTNLTDDPTSFPTQQGVSGTDLANAAALQVCFQEAANRTAYLQRLCFQFALNEATIWIPKTTGVSGALYDAHGTFTPSLGSSPTLPAYIAVGLGSTTPQIITSHNGDTWVSPTAVTTSTRGFRVTSNVWANAHGTVAVVMSVGSSGNNCQTSSDGVTWTSRTTGITLGTSIQSPNGQGNCVWASGLSLFVMVGGVGGAAAVSTSPTGVTWTARTLGASNNSMYDVAYSPSIPILVAVGFDSTANHADVWSSTDGSTWTQRSFPGATANQTGIAVTWNAEKAIFVAVSQAQSWSSPDGINWTLLGGFVNFPQGPTRLVWTGTQYLMGLNGRGGPGHQLSQSFDATNFVRRKGTTGSSGTNCGPQCLSMDLCGQLIAVGEAGGLWMGLSGAYI